MVMLSFRVEDFVPKMDMLHELFSDQWEELAKNKQLMVLKPDKAAYERLERAGNLLSIFVYDNDTIVGYSLNILTNHIHYADLKMAANDVIFLDKAYRLGPTGLKLIKETE